MILDVNCDLQTLLFCTLNLQPLNENCEKIKWIDLNFQTNILGKLPLIQVINKFCLKTQTGRRCSIRKVSAKFCFGLIYK